jgi:hypothetical protein
MRRHLIYAFLVTSVLPACELEEQKYEGHDKFPIERHELLPQYTWNNGQIAAGKVTGADAALEQPIQFSHNVHADMLGMQCEFCHSEARKSIHAGVPPTQTCMNCHTYVKTDSPEIKKVHNFYCGQDKCPPTETGENGQPIPWQKTHDLPDFVHFAHNRHVQAGVQCTECHGQVQLQGMKAPGEEYALATPVMVRESTLQMGWCINCHGSHPSVDENYGEKADLRRAELRDCWTCHK